MTDIFKLTLIPILACCLAAADASRFDYRVLATSKTSTMEKEMNEAAAAGFSFASSMGGETAGGSKEVLVVMTKDYNAPAAHKKYKLLCTSKTSTMQKELQAAGAEGFDYRGQTVFESAFGGQEVCVILEFDPDAGAGPIDYRLLATTKTSTMQKELQQAGDDGYKIQGVLVGKTAFGGKEVISLLKRIPKPQ